MNDKDLRVIKTKKALTDSLYSLLEEEAFSTITVNMICKNAGVHRTTFYKHFYDKFELLNQLLKLAHDDYFATDIKERLNNPFQTLGNTFNKEEISRIEHKQFNDKAFYEARNNYLIEIMQNDFKANMHRITVDGVVPKSLVFYVFGSVLNAFMDWKKAENVEIKPKQMDQIFHKLINVKAHD
ncbi:TetR/AcrR family transcriptional regulator [Staphylococcus borealis]|uniref:TetR/AcrR family transcriptional regulator n=1 Tax=Staphylococcus borealis TaxID=2742203 RepID=UPI002A8186CA|nr:TetR/AcrR family transcriptional regulator [Staphylococcus borealis]MDY4022996.1 TetR/AcrR family transcriptional regulator [Staphylococcus borealis]